MAAEGGGGVFAASALVVPVLAGAVILILLFPNRRDDQDDAVEDYEEFTFLSVTEEFLLQVRVPPINTITFFKGNHEKAAVAISQRLERLLTTNPWVRGRICKVEGKKALVWRKKIDAGIERECCLDVIVGTDRASVARSDVARKKDQMGADLSWCFADTNKMFKVTVLPDTEHPASRFAVVVSMNHVLGDGHTFYSLHNALFAKEKSEMVAMDRYYLTNSMEVSIAALGKEQCTMPKSAGFVTSLLMGYLWAKLPFSAQNHKTILIDSDAMLHTKQQSDLSDVDFVSSNDVLVSWFARLIRPTHLQMAVDVRNRVPPHSDHHAGNYQALMYFTAQDVNTPAQVRKSIPRLRRVSDDPWPRGLQLFSTNWALITNWSSSAAANWLPDCEEDFHMPIFEPQTLPRTLSSCIIFRASSEANGRKRLGMYLAGHSLRCDSEEWKREWISSSLD